MKMFNFYTRGGQLALHTFHMFKQICMATFLVSFCMGLFVFGGLFFWKTTSYQRYLYKEHVYAEFMVNMSQNDTSRVTQAFMYPSGTLRDVKSQDILRNPYIQAQISYVETLAYQSLKRSLWIALLSFILCIGFFVYSGYAKSKKKLERGNQLITKKQLRGLMRKKDQDSDLHLDGLPFVKDKETSHILITGTTSSGKTNCFNTLIPQIRHRSYQGGLKSKAPNQIYNKAIIIDTTGGFVSKYYREGKDILLNPFDVRSKAWSPWGECLTETHYDALASAIVPKSTAHDKFWENAGKALLASALKELAKQGEKDVQKLYHILVRSNMKDFNRFFEGTDAATYTQEEGEKMTLSIRATLANHLQAFKFLKPTHKGFSIREWIQDEEQGLGSRVPRLRRGNLPKKNPKGWLFISLQPDQRETLIPLVSGWLDTAINALMTLPPNDKRRLWFIIDELPSLQKLPSLETAMAESRKYGGCIVAGVQNFSQLSHTYGRYQAQSILDQFNTKIFFRNTDPTITGWISKVLGEAETTEQVENLSYGAHTIRDGVSLSPHTRTKPLVLPTEIASLEDLEAYVKLPGSYPACKIKMTYKNIPPHTHAFKPISEAEINKRLKSLGHLNLENLSSGRPSLDHLSLAHSFKEK